MPMGSVWLLGDFDLLVVCSAETKRKDSYIGHPLPFLWHEGSPRYQKKKKKKKTKQKNKNK